MARKHICKEDGTLEKTDLQALINSEKGSGFAEIFKIIEDKTFVDSGYAIEDGEKLVGEMSLLEKGISTFAERLTQRHNSIADSLRSMVERNEEETETFKQALKEMRKVRTQVDFYAEIMWASIRERFDDKNLKSVGVRSGFQVVKTKKSEKGEECDCPACALTRGEGLSALGIAIVGGSPFSSGRC